MFPVVVNNFFFWTKCESAKYGKGQFCSFCLTLKDCLNSYVLKICIFDEDLKHFDFKTKQLNKYLFQDRLMDPSFVFHKDLDII